MSQKKVYCSISGHQLSNKIQEDKLNYQTYEKLLEYSFLFEERMMDLEVNISLEEALNLGWETLKECFNLEEIGIKKSLSDKYWPKG